MRCNKTSRNLFKCSKCDRHYDTKCLKLRSKPSARWICESCTKAANAKKRKTETATETISAFKFQTKKQYRPAPSDEDDSEAETEVEVRKSQRNSLRRKRDSSPPVVSSRLSSSRRSRVSTELLLDNVLLIRFIDEISKHTEAWPFLRPVTRSEVPDYHKVIKSPMDLAKIKSNLNMGKYSSNYDFINDLQLMFTNCDLYNINGSEIYR